MVESSKTNIKRSYGVTAGEFKEVQLVQKLWGDRAAKEHLEALLKKRGLV